MILIKTIQEGHDITSGQHKLASDVNGVNELLRSWATQSLKFNITGPTCDTDRDERDEYSDAYGNPVIVLLSSEMCIVKNQNGNEYHVKVEGIEQRKSFAVWSMGPNGVNEYGMGDDIGWTCYRINDGEVTEKGIFTGKIEWTRKDE